MAKKNSSKAEAPTKIPNKRKHIRFAPGPMVAYLMTDADGKYLKVPVPCLVIEESYGGCGLIAPLNSSIEKDAVLVFRVGQLADMPAQIRWVKTYDKKICYFGIEYTV